MSDPGTHTWAHLSPFGTNVLAVVAFPRHHITRLAGILDAAGTQWNPVLMSGDGLPGALLLFSPSAFTDDEVAGLVTTIAAADGFWALGHVGFHDHEVGHTHLFRPVGPPPTDPFDAPVFIQGLEHEDATIEVWLFGTHEPLLNVSDLMKQFFVDAIEPVETPAGWAAASCTLNGGDARGDYAIIEDTITCEGWDVHVRPLQRFLGTT